MKVYNKDGVCMEASKDQLETILKADWSRTKPEEKPEPEDSKPEPEDSKSEPEKESEPVKESEPTKTIVKSKKIRKVTPKK